MEEIIKTVLNQAGLMGAIMIALALYLVKKEVAFAKQQERWESSNETRHKEVVTLTQDTVKAIAEIKAELQSVKLVLSDCEHRNGRA